MPGRFKVPGQDGAGGREHDGDEHGHRRGEHQLYHSRISGWSLLVLVLAAAVTVFVAVVFSPASPILARYFEATWHSFTYWLTGKF